MNAQLAEASRAAREAFGKVDKTVFEDATKLAEKLGQQFSVPKSRGYGAELDIQGAAMTGGSVSLHDGDLPLRTLGTGSSRLLVAGLQHGSGGSSITLVDEVEHGLEPHRIARLLKFLRDPTILVGAEDNGQDESRSGSQPQVFMTSHSPVVVRELTVGELHSVRPAGGHVQVRSVAENARDEYTAQRHVRATPEAFLAPRVLIGEGKTECGLMRGLDAKWIASDRESFAYQGVATVDGGGSPQALAFAEHLLELGYEVLVLLDSDKEIDEPYRTGIPRLGGTLLPWPGACSTEQRIFNDVPWLTVCELIEFAVECHGSGRILHTLNQALSQGMDKFTNTDLSAVQDTPELRQLIAAAATWKTPQPSGKDRDLSWFKDISRAEGVAAIIFHSLEAIKEKPLSVTLSKARDWIDGRS